MTTLPVATPSASLPEVAVRVVRDYLGTQAGERFVLVTDDAVSVEIYEAILQAARDCDVDPLHARIGTRRTSGEEPPAPVVAALVGADVFLCIASKSIYHTAAKGIAQQSGTRGCFNAPADIGAWTEGAMTADYSAIRALAERPAAGWGGGRLVRVTSRAGADIPVSREGREPRGWYTGIVRNPGEISAFPGGGVSFPPVEGSSNGVIVFERVMTDLGRIAEPITISVEDG